MSLAYSAIVPHPPILIPGIGKENRQRLAATVASFSKIEEKLREKKIETIIIISPHGLIQANSFSMNLSPEFNADFEEFGDFSTKKTWNGNVGLAHKIREHLETTAPLQLMTEKDLDHGVSVPLVMLTENLPDIKIIPLYYSGLSNEAHFKFGQVLKRDLIVSHEQVAVIASGDLSHRITKNAPAGYSPKGKRFDKKLTDFLLKKDVKKILEMEEDLIAEAGQCGLKSILIQQGIIDGINYRPEILSYEAPFGVGYLAMEFEI
jgi:AmmeMemoRadiSam system protein B